MAERHPQKNKKKSASNLHFEHAPWVDESATTDLTFTQHSVKTLRNVVVAPVPEPEGWNCLRPLIQRRLDSGVSQGQLAVAMLTTSSWLSALERGRVPRVTAAHVARYRAALDSVVEKLAAAKSSGTE